MPGDRRFPWDIVAVVAVQVAVLAAIAVPAESIRRSGRDISLRTVPVDPYDLLSGYYVTLEYEVERLPAAPTDDLSELWITVVPGEPAWTAVTYSRDRVGAAADTAEIRLVRGRRGFGIPNAGRLYIPEAERERVADLLRAARGIGIVDMKVDSAGDVSVLRLRVGDATFGEGR